ncbi:large ribosomal subunit protein mL52 isoform X2 [Hyperolius riggenbachi]|uniref:large ribosomal subunit protein mL52 isoform X2 n=1 Tax=Hyperolius riggenbachi TaxID=752182 RepID=UPI0035A3B934
MAASLLGAHLQQKLPRTLVSCICMRSLQNSAFLCAGQDWRIKHGFARSDSEYGPLTDLPDWSFADGRTAPLWKSQIRRKEENKAMASRIILLSNEIDEGIKKWNNQQEELRQKEVLRQKSLLKSKALFPKKPKSK